MTLRSPALDYPGCDLLSQSRPRRTLSESRSWRPPQVAGPPRFARDELALTDVLLGLGSPGARTCRRSGSLIGHGQLRGYTERCLHVVEVDGRPSRFG